MEATTQLWDAPFAPNAAVLELSAFMPQLSAPPSRMVAARLRDSRFAPHAGMVVQFGECVIATDFVLLLVAVKEIWRQ